MEDWLKCQISSLVKYRQNQNAEKLLLVKMWQWMVAISGFMIVLLYIQIDDYSLVRFLPLDQTDEDSINDILLQIDTCLQYGEDLEPREMRVSVWRAAGPIVNYH